MIILNVANPLTELYSGNTQYRADWFKPIWANMGHIMLAHFYVMNNTNCLPIQNVYQYKVFTNTVHLVKAGKCSWFYLLDVVVVDTELHQWGGQVPGHLGQPVVRQVELLHAPHGQEGPRVNLGDGVVHQDQSLAGQNQDQTSQDQNQNQTSQDQNQNQTSQNQNQNQNQTQTSQDRTTTRPVRTRTRTRTRPVRTRTRTRSVRTRTRTRPVRTGQANYLKPRNKAVFHLKEWLTPESNLSNSTPCHHTVVIAVAVSDWLTLESLQNHGSTASLKSNITLFLFDWN